MMRFADGIPQSGPAGPDVAAHADCRKATIPRKRVARKGDPPKPPLWGKALQRGDDPMGANPRSFCAIARRSAMLRPSFTTRAGACIRPRAIGHGGSVASCRGAGGHDRFPRALSDVWTAGEGLHDAPGG